jgi:DtxR family Mn-dependent transcriptional regulator
MKLSDKAEEILESMWIAIEEEGRKEAGFDLIGVSPADLALVELESIGLISVENEFVTFLPAGRVEGEKTIRRHRLAERLMMDVFNIHGDSAESKACQFEHLLDDGVDVKLCTMLNHPSTCPHGKRIPPGDCCEEARKSGDIGVVSLTELKPGESGEIAYILTEDSKKMQKLMAMGVLPGNSINLMQSFPSYIFRVGYSEFAIDTAMAREIFVRR